MKRILPERLFTDFDQNAIVIEYLVEIYDDISGQVSSEKKQRKIVLKDLDSESNLSRLAVTLVQKCKYIPEKWVAEVEFLLREIQKRKNANNQKLVHDSFDVVTSLDNCLELIYGCNEDKIAATTDILKLCKQKEHLEVIARHHQMMSALSRILSDDSGRSVHLTFNIGKICLALSTLIRLHPFLASYRVGSLMMSAIELEIRRCELRDADAVDKPCKVQGQGGTEAKDVFRYRQDQVIFVCLNVLIRLSDDMAVFRKMLKRGLLPIICSRLERTSKDCLLASMALLKRASVFEEVALEMGGGSESKCGILIKLLSVNDEIVVFHILRVLFNLSFSLKCRNAMLQMQLIPNLTRLMKKSRMRALSLQLIYNVSADRNCRKHLRTDDLVSIIVQLILKFPRKNVAKELGAVAINASLEPLCAEQMILHVEKFLDRIEEFSDLLLAKVVRNLSLWTRRLQHGIETFEEENVLASLTKSPSRFVQDLPDDIAYHRDNHVLMSKYQSCKFWNNHVDRITISFADNESEDISLEMLGTLNNMTHFDMPSKKTWLSLISEYSLPILITKLIMPGMSQNDLKLEAIILTSEMCEDEACANLIAESQLITSVVKVWEDCDEDIELLLQLLSLFQIFLQFNVTRNFLLLETDAIQYIFSCIDGPNDPLRHPAERCLDLIQEFDKDKTGSFGKFAKMAIERRFSSHNDHWLHTGSPLHSI